MEDKELKDEKISVSLKVTGAVLNLEIEARVSLLDALREFAGLTGTKKCCNQGACGACTFLIDDETRINSCLALAAQYEGASITTIEGLANEAGELRALAAGVHRTRRFSMRLLHARTDLFGNRDVQRIPERIAGRSNGINEPESRRRSPTRFSTRPANASASYRSRSTNCCRNGKAYESNGVILTGGTGGEDVPHEHI